MPSRRPEGNPVKVIPFPCSNEQADDENWEAPVQVESPGTATRIMTQIDFVNPTAGSPEYFSAPGPGTIVAASASAGQGGSGVADYEERYLGQLEKAVDRIEERLTAISRDVQALDRLLGDRLDRAQQRTDERFAHLEGQMNFARWSSIALVVTVVLGVVGIFWAALNAFGALLHQ